MSDQIRALADQLDAAFRELDLAGRLKALRAAVKGRIVFTTSLGIEDQAVAHAIFSENLDIEVVTLDTGRLFPETYDLWAQTEERYGRRIKPFYPLAQPLEQLVEDQGINGFYHSLDARKACCTVRKVEPLARALAGAEIWVTGLRGDQSAHRGSLHFVEADGARNLVKANPIFDWTRERTAEFTRANDVPVNALHGQGFLSIGCAPCTRAIAPGEPERAGRWWWEDEAKKECGLHIGADGKIQRAAPDVKSPEAFETVQS
jgi:phosphoadenosine phosphosulfate reductase